MEQIVDSKQERNLELSPVLVPLLSVVVALSCGAILVFIQGINPILAYKVLFTTAFCSLDGIAITLAKATPLILSGLAVAICLRAGLFNIGAQGQLISGALASAWAGYTFVGLPALVHIPLALIFGAFFGAIVALIAAVLKAYRGVHEVITTIMLNSIVIALADYLTSNPFKEPDQPLTRTPKIQASARMNELFGLPLGFFLAIGFSIALWWIMRNTTTGFGIETIGRNKNAGWYAGISVKKTIILSMLIGGAVAGVAGAVETLSIVGRFEPAFNAGLGFDGITVALLGRANPLGVIPAAILIGGMRASGSTVQFEAGVAPELVDLLLAMILFFVTAPLLSKFFKNRKENVAMTSGWSN
ncbi:MAG: ABC transporter permease [Actinobacteria bacterium]|nr:ABC transporter permease [Actinomycetota bacterium]